MAGCWQASCRERQANASCPLHPFASCNRPQIGLLSQIVVLQAFFPTSHIGVSLLSDPKDGWAFTGAPKGKLQAVEVEEPFFFFQGTQKEHHWAFRFFGRQNVRHARVSSQGSAPGGGQRAGGEASRSLGAAAEGPAKWAPQIGRPSPVQLAASGYDRSWSQQSWHPWKIWLWLKTNGMPFWGR